MGQISCLENVGVGLWGGDISDHQDSSKEMCQYRCQKNPKCIFFTFVDGVSILLKWTFNTIISNSYFQTCYLKHSWESQNKNAGSNHVSGYGWCPVSQGLYYKCHISTRKCNTNIFTDTCYIYNSDFWGNDIGPVDNIATTQQCQRECQKELECGYFTYIEQSRKCYLKRAVSNVDHNTPGKVTGWESCKFFTF